MNRDQYQKPAFTIIEVILAMLVLSIAISGAMAFRYFSMLDARKAETRMTAARIGTLLLETWRGSGGSSLFDPLGSIDPGILEINGQDAALFGGEAGVLPGNFTRLPSTSDPDYRIVLNGHNYYVTLSYQDIDTDTDGIYEIRLLNSDIRWRRDLGEGTVTQSDQAVRFTTCVNL
ncbi:type IV pilus modification PilV family protein [Anaerohalosphaera lusitana]|nr:prepilin-type N-terminal cleavage/methylation domain-containing protein [Anaerohalosphaera lusitana]